MVLDQRTAKTAPDVEKLTSEQQRCLLGSNCLGDGMNKFDFLKNEKKKVQVGKDQEKAQSEKDSHSKNRGGKKPN